MSEKLREIDFHITDVCLGHCPMCYATEEDMCRKHGDLETLKKVVHNAIANGEVERFVMVGGDPCEHPHLVELLKYIKAEGKKYDVKTKTIVLSNTHDYKENGKPVSIEEVAPYIDEMDVTVHGATPEVHDAFNGCPGSYEHVMENVKKFIGVKNSDQEVCAIMNVMPHTVKHMESIMLNTALNLDGKVDFFGIQRIAPSGRACGETKYFIEQIDVNSIMQIFKKIKTEHGFNVEFIDVFPWCAVKPEYRDMLPKGGCNWGTEVCAVYSDGTVSRCAMSDRKLSANMAELDTPEKFAEFWETDQELVKFRKRAHLDEQCRACSMLADCGGGCTMARKSGDPYKQDVPEQGHDYLANRNCEEERGR